MPYVLEGAKHFKSKVNLDGPDHPTLGKCWLWTGYKFDDGYGGIMVQYEFMRVHRYSYRVHIGPIPDGLRVLHKCDTPLCVNPDHLFEGTDLENKLDCVAKDRHARGERHGECKLTDEKVREIRRIYRKGVRGKGALSIARLFGVSKPIVLGIIHGTGWRHVV